MSPRGSGIGGSTAPPRNLGWSDNSRWGREGSAGRETEGLREAMEEQKRAVSVTSNKINKLQAKPGYYPLSEGKIVARNCLCVLFVF